MPILHESSEQYIPFRHWRTWVSTTVPTDHAGRIPVVVLHGGPGMAHDYVQNFARLASAGRTVVHYDQVGCGRSTHLPDAPAAFWNVQLFVDEFFNLVAALGLARYHLIGQSWGGMLAAEIATRRPSGLQSLVICNSPASMALWVEGANRLRRELPDETRSALDRHEAAGTTENADYLAATQVFYDRHVCRVIPAPADFQASVDQMEAEPTVYHTMNGPNEFHVIGTLRSWSVIDELSAVEVPTLVVAGEYDEAVPESWAPFVERIDGAGSHVFPGGSHCVHLEQPDAFFAVVGDFIARHDGRPDRTPPPREKSPR